MGIIYKNGIPYGNQPNGTVPSGGTTGQVLKKASNTDYDTEWANESGGGGTSDYTQLSNKPQINGNTLTGNQTGAQLGLVDAVTGKQLSTEDYTTAEKTKLSGIEAQANKTVIDDTLTNTGEAADAKAVGDEISDVRNTLNQLDSNLWVVVNGNVATSAFKTGQYVYLKNSTISGKQDGLYIASANASQGAVIDVTYISGNPIAVGGFNYLLPVYVEASNSSFEATTSWKYTGVSLQIPARHTFIGEAHAYYNNNSPVAVAMCDSSTNVNAQFANGGINGASAYASFVRASLGGSTVYLWAKYGGTGINTVGISGLLIPYQY